MAAVSNIVLTDAQATPVNHTFIPLGKDAKGVWWFEDQSGDSAIGYNRLSISITRPSQAAVGQVDKGDRVNRVRIGISTPKPETLGTGGNGFVPAPTLAYVERFSAEFILPDRGNLQGRKDLRKYASTLLANTHVVNAVELLQNIY